MTIGIFYGREPYDDPNLGPMYVSHPQFRYFLSELIKAGESQGIKTVLLCKNRSFIGGKKFKYYWQPYQKDVTLFEKIDQEIEIDVIYDKGHFKHATNASIINTPALAKLGRDKNTQYQLFKEFMPRSFSVSSSAELKNKLGEIRTSKAVIKPNDKNGGSGVVIQNKHEFKDMVLPGKNYILQEFIDSSCGIKGIVDGIHDLRLYVVDGKVGLVSVRTPQEGKLISNTSQGGTIKFIAPDKVMDQRLVTILMSVDRKFKEFGSRYYSIDFMRDAGNWYMIETNDRPGIPAIFQSPNLVLDFHNLLIGCIIDAAKNPINLKAAAEI